MCGIFLNMENEVEQKFISDMFVMDALRGKDSCGIITVTLNEVETHKDAVPALEFIKQKGYSKVMWKNTKAAVGHNRAATAGVVNAKNAHPFTQGNITGVHNGTLRGQHRLPEHTQFDVDSENIFYAINKIGIAETWKLIDGAAALIWYNNDENTINFIRNSARELYLTLSPTGEIYMASEKFMMLAAMERNGLTWTDVDIVPTDTLHTVDVKTREIKKEVLEAGNFPIMYNYGQNWSDCGGSWYNKTSGKKGRTVGRNTKGTTVNFIVDYIELNLYCDYYYVTDNSTTPLTYHTIEDYRHILNMKVGDKGSSTIASFSNGESFLSVFNVQKEEDKRDEPTDICLWCQSVIKDTDKHIIDVDGDIYCEECSKLDTIKETLKDLDYTEVN